MSDFSLDPEMQIEVYARFISKGTGEALTGEDYTVRLFDKDLFDADFLGESGLDHNGFSKIGFAPTAFGDLVKLEQFPDLYFVLYKNGAVIFKSKVMEDVDLSAVEQYKKGEGEVINLGIFLVDPH